MGGDGEKLKESEEIVSYKKWFIMMIKSLQVNEFQF